MSFSTTWPSPYLRRRATPAGRVVVGPGRRRGVFRGTPQPATHSAPPSHEGWCLVWAPASPGARPAGVQQRRKFQEILVGSGQPCLIRRLLRVGSCLIWAQASPGATTTRPARQPKGFETHSRCRVGSCRGGVVSLSTTWPSQYLRRWATPAGRVVVGPGRRRGVFGGTPRPAKHSAPPSHVGSCLIWAQASPGATTTRPAGVASRREFQQILVGSRADLRQGPRRVFHILPTAVLPV